MDRIYLVGSEDVSSAAGTMSHAASEMNRAASSISDNLATQRQYMEEWICRFEQAVEKMSKSTKTTQSN